MEVLLSAQLEGKIDELASASGQSREAFLEDAIAGYVQELEQVRTTLDSRYDDMVNGRVQAVSSEELLDHFRRKSAARNSKRP